MLKSGVIRFVFLTVFLKNALAISDEQKLQIQAKFLEVGVECLKDYPISIDDISSFKNKVFPDSNNASCFSACIFNKTGLFDDKGTLTHTTALEHAKKVFDDEEELESLGEFLTFCAKVNEEEVNDGEKGCERARLAFDCFVKNSDQFGFNIEF